MSNLIEVNTVEEFEKHNKGNVVIDFWADWCSPCRMMSPVFKELSENNPEVTFIKINVDESVELSQKFGIRSIPQFNFLKDGEEVGKKVGANPIEAMQKQIDQMN